MLHFMIEEVWENLKINEPTEKKLGRYDSRQHASQAGLYWPTQGSEEKFVASSVFVLCFLLRKDHDFYVRGTTSRFPGRDRTIG